MSEFQEDTTNMDDALASFVSVERVRHGIDEEPASVDAEPAPDEDPADESAAAADDEQPGDGQAVDDSASGDDTPPEDPDDSPDTTDGDGPQADAGEDTRTQEELLEALKKSEERVVALEHTNDSNKGRVKALQRKGQSLRNQLSALGTSRVGPSQETAQRELTEAESELAQLKEEMGEDYPATIKLVNAALRVNSLRTAGAVDEKLDPLRTAAETLITEEVHSDSVEVAELLSAKYDVPGLVNSEGFAKWLEVLPPTYRELFDNSEDPADQLMILDTYAEGARCFSNFWSIHRPRPNP